MAEMAIMDSTGDTKVIWNRDNVDEVEAAKATFTKLVGKGYAAYSVKKDGEKNEVIKKFDPDAERIILAPAMVGG